MSSALGATWQGWDKDIAIVKQKPFALADHTVWLFHLF